MKITITDSELKKLLKDCEVDVEEDLVGIDYDKNNFFVYAYTWIKMQSEEVVIKLYGHEISLTDSQIKYVYDYMLSFWNVEDYPEVEEEEERDEYWNRLDY